MESPFEHEGQSPGGPGSALLMALKEHVGPLPALQDFCRGFGLAGGGEVPELARGRQGRTVRAVFVWAEDLAVTGTGLTGTAAGFSGPQNELQRNVIAGLLEAVCSPQARLWGISSGTATDFERWKGAHPDFRARRAPRHDGLSAGFFAAFREALQQELGSNVRVEPSEWLLVSFGAPATLRGTRWHTRYSMEGTDFAAFDGEPGTMERRFERWLGDADEAGVGRELDALLVSPRAFSDLLSEAACYAGHYGDREFALYTRSLSGQAVEMAAGVAARAVGVPLLALADSSQLAACCCHEEDQPIQRDLPTFTLPANARRLA